jgi:eukaryotic-like serine/threonine-protein kinase
MELAGYSDLNELAQGGMAKVYKARQLSLNRIVAIKFLSAEMLWNDDAKSLFDQESLVVAQLNHPNIIHIIDRGLTEKGRPYFVMEFIKGHDLSEVIKKNELSPDKKINLVLQISKGIACAHKNGVIHRDIKPENILIDADDHVHILDFGIAWLAASGKPENILGTPDYMSPEQFSAPETVSCLSDIYSLGVLMYQLFTNELPTAYLDNLSVSMRELPSPLSKLIEQCLETKIEKRPQSAEEIRLRLLHIIKGAHIDRRHKAEAEEISKGIKSKFSLFDIVKHDKYGAVYLFENNTNNNLLIIKKSINSKAGYREAKILGQIDHPNIIKILGTSKNNKTFIVVMEYMNRGSLQDRLLRPYSVDQFVVYARKICSAMKHAHKYKIIHGDLRPSNILYDDKDIIKISDFGHSSHYSESKGQSDWYQPHDSAGLDKKHDVYSAGIIFYQMLTGAKPEINRGFIKTEYAFNKLDDRLQNMLLKMIEQDSNGNYGSFGQVISDLNQIKPESIKDQIKDKIKIEVKETFKFKKLVMLMLLIELFLVVVFLYYNPHYFFAIKNIMTQFIHWISGLILKI